MNINFNLVLESKPCTLNLQRVGTLFISKTMKPLGDTERAEIKSIKPLKAN